MNREKYYLIRHRSGMRFDFISKGPKGSIWKTIRFDKKGGNQYNLAFGDWDESLNKIDDQSRSNNLDRDKLLNTVANAVLEFLKHHPGAEVVAHGSTPARTRLYQMAINANWFEVNTTLNISGYCNGAWERMEKNKNYESFMVTDFFKH